MSTNALGPIEVAAARASVSPEPLPQNRRRAGRLGLFLLLLAGLAIEARAQTASAGARPSAPDETKPTRPSVVPFDMLATNHMVVNARLNGKGPYRLIFDLGAPITLLSNRASEGAGVIKKDAPRSLLFSMRGEAEVNRLEVGGLTVKRLPVIIMDHPALKALGGFFGRPLDGIIGYTFFARYKTTIDYQTRQMTFEPVDFEVRNLMRDLPERIAGPKIERTRILTPGAYFGLTVGEPANGLDAAGVPVKTVLPDSPAAAAGLRPGDVLTTLAGRWTTSVADVYAAAATATPGQNIPAVVLRDGHEQTLTITPRAGL